MTDTNRRTILKTGAAAALMAAAPARFAQSASHGPIKIGFQQHSTGIGAAYGRWYGRTTDAAVKKINAEGGINGWRSEHSSPTWFMALHLLLES